VKILHSVDGGDVEQ